MKFYEAPEMTISMFDAVIVMDLSNNPDGEEMASEAEINVNTVTTIE